MEAALAEMSVDDLMQDVEEDVDFVSKGEPLRAHAAVIIMG